MLQIIFLVVEDYTDFDALVKEVSGFDPTVLSFLKSMLNIDGRKRETATQLVKHEFITEGVRQIGIRKSRHQIGQMGQEMMGMEINEAKEKLGNELFNASKAGSIGNMKDAIEGRADLDWKNKDNFGFTPLIASSQFGKVEAVSLLLKVGADIKSTNEWNTTALWTACQFGKAEVEKVLLQNGANKEAVSRPGTMPFSEAIDFWH